MMGEIILRVMAWAAQAELESIKRRIEAGVRRAAEEGRFPGRPKALTPDQTAAIRLLRRNGQSQSAVARTFGISRQTVWRAEAVLGTRRTVILLRPAWYRTWWPTTVHPEVPCLQRVIGPPGRVHGALPPTGAGPLSRGPADRTTHSPYPSAAPDGVNRDHHQGISADEPLVSGTTALTGGGAGGPGDADIPVNVGAEKVQGLRLGVGASAFIVSLAAGSDVTVGRRRSLASLPLLG